MSSIIFRKTNSIEPVAQYLTKAINTKLMAGQKVLWLVAGGSSVEVAVLTSQKLNSQPLQSLIVTLTDERYGEIGHKDSNWQQLMQAGFSLPDAKLQPILNGENFENTTKSFNNLLNQYLRPEVYKIGLFGIGADGHTAGILPNSIAVGSTELATKYEASNYHRITITPKAISQLNVAVVYAVNKSKHQALDDLEKDLPIETQPAQILKQVPNLIVYNDYKGERV